MYKGIHLLLLFGIDIFVIDEPYVLINEHD